MFTQSHREKKEDGGGTENENNGKEEKNMHRICTRHTQDINKQINKSRSICHFQAAAASFLPVFIFAQGAITPSKWSKVMSAKEGEGKEEAKHLLN